MPSAGKPTVVTAEAGAPKTATPGPLTWLHNVVTGVPERPSSVADPTSIPTPGSVTV